MRSTYYNVIECYMNSRRGQPSKLQLILVIDPFHSAFIYLFKIAFVAAIEFIYFCHISSADGARFTAAGILRFPTYHALTAIAHIILILCWRKQTRQLKLFLFSYLDQKIFHFC